MNKLVKRFEADPERVRRKMRAFAPANLEKLERARAETQRQRERGWLRGPIRWRRVKITLDGKKRKMGTPTRAEMERREALKAVTNGQGQGERDSASRAGRVNPAPTRANAMLVRYQELPTWARGLLLPGDAGTGRGLDTRMPVSKSTPRQVPFAFRRRR
ncbi:MAG TPA: hypothetical protein VKS20_05205 [Candidatus Acidoferrales bacterium]|nr:hypothetical protein [Candidatus Acidoferrales bacterium]